MMAAETKKTLIDILTEPKDRTVIYVVFSVSFLRMLMIVKLKRLV